MKRMPMVPPELGVGSLERGVTVGLRLLDTVIPSISHCSEIHVSIGVRSGENGLEFMARVQRWKDAYPFRWFFLD